MEQAKQLVATLPSLLAAKFKDYMILSKARLSSLVIFSALIGYYFGAAAPYWLDMLVVAAGGFLITAAANALNQILERDIDQLMNRTRNRPLAAGRMHLAEATLLAGLGAVSGLSLLALYFSPIAGLLGAISLVSYAFIYTPLKRVSPIAVFVGAIPGALPPLIGYVCATGRITEAAIVIFFIQFIWQFPHFWAIAWKSFEDYGKAGIMLLPDRRGKTKTSALMSLVYVLVLIPSPVFLWMSGELHVIATAVIMLAGVAFAIPAFKLFKRLDDASAKQLMFASFLYLPVALIALLIGKL